MHLRDAETCTVKDTAVQTSLCSQFLGDTGLSESHLVRENFVQVAPAVTRMSGGVQRYIWSCCASLQGASLPLGCPGTTRACCPQARFRDHVCIMFHVKHEQFSNFTNALFHVKH